MSTTLWELSDVTLRGRSRARLDGVTLTISAGTTAVLGYSGAGKTSLLNVLTEFEQPNAGECRFVAHARGATHAESEAQARLPLFWVPQDHGLWPHLTVGQHLRVVASSDSSSQAGTLLEAFDLTEVADAYPEQLSQGERARVSVARALMSRAAVLVMDEPLAHVDPPRIGRQWRFLQQWCREQGTSLLFATHQPDAVLRMAEQVVCLAEGRVIFQGALEDLYYRPPSQALSAFLGPGNWMTASEMQTWLTASDASRSPAADTCIRPEQLQITRTEQSPLRVESATFAGGLAEIEILDERSRRQRTFYHRAHAPSLRAGDRVILRLCLLVMCLLAVAGCGTAAGENSLPVAQEEIRTWILPNDGPKIPAPRGLHVDADNELYVLDDAGRVLVYGADRRLDRQWKMPEYDVGKPEGICVLQDGRVAVADTHYHRVVFFDDRGHVTGMLGEKGHGPSQFIYPVAVLQDDDEDIYVCEYGGNDRVQKFSSDGTFLLQIGESGIHDGQFMRPSGAVWHKGLLYIVDAFNNRIQVFTDEGEFQGYFGMHAGQPAELFYPYDIAQGPDGRLFVVEYKSNRVTCFEPDGQLVGHYGAGGTRTGQFSTPWGLAVDKHGHVFVADTGNRRMVELPL